MKQIKLYLNHALRISLLGVFLSIVTACSTSNGNGANGDATTLQIITPKTMYSTSSASNGYITIQNSTASTVKNIHYATYDGVGSGSRVQVDGASALSCSIMLAYSQCTIQVTVPANSVAGSFSIKATNKDSQGNGSSLQKLAQSATQAPTTSLPVGIEQAAYNTTHGADGITLSYYNTVINGIPYVLVSGVVASSNAGSFNNIVLVDNNGNPLPNQQKVSGVLSNTQGSTFAILIPVPATSGATQTIKVQTQQVASDDKVAVVSTATSSSTLTTIIRVGVVNMLPSAIYLTEANPEQTITLTNSGDAAADLKSLMSNNPNIEVIFSTSSLASGASTTATLRLIEPKAVAASGAITLSYNNGQQEIQTSADAEQNVNPQPTPTPPVVGLTASFSPDNYFFTSTAVGTVSRQMTLKNTGNTAENNIVLILPANFAISEGNSNSCGVFKDTITNTVSANSICDITVTYNNSSATPESSSNISIEYNYNNGMAAPTPTSAAVNYRVTQSTANLSISASPSPADYGSIVNDNTTTTSPITYTVTNSGDETAMNLEFSFIDENEALFHYNAPPSVSAGECGHTLSSANGVNSCTISSSTTIFGLAANGTPTGNKTASFEVAYTQYASGDIAYNSIVVSGNVTQELSAGFRSAITANTFSSGDGSESAPYTGYKGEDYTLSITYTNDSTIPATGFTTSNQTLPSNWSRTNHGCNEVDMLSGGTCTDIYTLNSSSTSEFRIDLFNLTTASWSDSSGSYTDQLVSGVSTVYVRLSEPPLH